MSKSSKRWLRERHRDEFVKLARAGPYRSRAVYKLQEIDRRDDLFKGVSMVVDLGASPGGWSQYAAQRLGRGARLVAVDVLPMDPIDGVEFIQGDFRSPEVPGAVTAALGGRRADLVMSDMAPNLSGTASVDQARAMHLCELALDLAREVLAAGGALLAKTFHGEGYEAFAGELRASFATVRVRKPRASRPRSREVYLLARAYRP